MEDRPHIRLAGDLTSALSPVYPFSSAGWSREVSLEGYIANVS